MQENARTQIKQNKTRKNKNKEFPECLRSSCKAFAAKPLIGFFSNFNCVMRKGTLVQQFLQTTCERWPNGCNFLLQIIKTFGVRWEKCQATLSTQWMHLSAHERACGIGGNVGVIYSLAFHQYRQSKQKINYVNINGCLYISVSIISLCANCSARQAFYYTSATK